MRINPRLLALLFPTFAASAGAAEYSVVAHYPIAGEVRYDYLRVDPVARRLYVSHATKVEVLDADTGAKIGEIGPMKGIHGIAVVPEFGRGFITAGQDRAVVMFDLKTLAITKVIPDAGPRPDAVTYDPDTRRVYVANGSSGGITVIDPEKGEIVARVSLDGNLEEIVFDGKGRLFVNTENRSAIQVVDTHTLKLLATWPIAPAEGGTGLMIDVASHRLFSAGANGLLAVVDSDTGAVVATPAIGEDPDGGGFDAAHGLVFTSSMLGTVSVLHEDAPNSYSLVQTVPTAFGARTMALDDRTGRLYLATGRFKEAAVPTADNPHPRRQGEAGSFEVLVVGR
jgi:DNA-binding beta-propeller fold protein YncE